jgi:hypothetical protein
VVLAGGAVDIVDVGGTSTPAEVSTGGAGGGGVVAGGGVTSDGGDV